MFSNQQQVTVLKEESIPIPDADVLDEAPRASPKRSRRGGTSSSSSSSSTGALLTPVRNSETQQRSPKSDFKNFAENMGGSPLPFGLGGLFSPSPSGVPFTPGTSTSTMGMGLGLGMGLEEEGGGPSMRSGTGACVAIPTSRDWSPLCGSSAFDFEGGGSASSPSSSSCSHPHLMDKMYHSFRAGAGAGVGQATSSDQSPAEYISGSAHAWGHLLPSSSSPMGDLSFPPAPLPSSSSSSLHLYPHHQTPGAAAAGAGSELQSTRRSNDLFSANSIPANRRNNAKAAKDSSSDDKKRKLDSCDAAGVSVSGREEFLSLRGGGMVDNDAPPSPGFDAIAAAARELESQGTGAGKARRKGTDKKPPLTGPQGQGGGGLLKGVVGRLSYSTTSEGEQYPCMSFTNSNTNNNTNSSTNGHSSTSPNSTKSNGFGGSSGSATHAQKSSGKVFPYLPQKASSDEEITTKKSIKSEIQTYTQGNNDPSHRNSGGDSSDRTSRDHPEVEAAAACSPKLLAQAGQQGGAPDISPAMKLTTSIAPATATTTSTTCNCKKSKCLKLYCDCFRVQQYCDGCHCNNCSNSKEFDSERQRAVAAITERNPEAFKPRITQGAGAGGAEDPLRGGGQGQHLQGCHCKKSACLKKYCECFQAEVPCHDRCRCLECKNTPAAREAKLQAAGKTGRDKGAGAGMAGFSRAALTPGSVAASAAGSSSVLMLKTYDDPSPSSSSLSAGGGHRHDRDTRRDKQSSHLDLKTALLSPPPSSCPPRDKLHMPGCAPLQQQEEQEEEDNRPIYNKAQAEQAALEIVSAFLRGELTVPGLEYLHTKASAMRHYSSPPPPQGSAGTSAAHATTSSLPLMEKLSDFEESREQQGKARNKAK